MLLLETALKPYIDSITKEYFTSEEDPAILLEGDVLTLILFVILSILFILFESFISKTWQ